MKKGGFTLVEVLIVVAIIGLLASVILVGLGGFRARGRDARRIADLREVQNGLELYYTKNNSYPPAGGSWANLTAALQQAEIGITQIPHDPLYPKKNYVYGVSDDGHSYVVGAELESDNTGLADDIDGIVYGVNCNDPVYCIQF